MEERVIQARACQADQGIQAVIIGSLNEDIQQLLAVEVFPDRLQGLDRFLDLICLLGDFSSIIRLSQELLLDCFHLRNVLFLPAGGGSFHQAVENGEKLSVDNDYSQVIMLASAGQIKQASALAAGDLATSGATVQAALDQLGVAINSYNAAARKNVDGLATTMLVVSIAIGCLAVLICIGIVISLVKDHQEAPERRDHQIGHVDGRDARRSEPGLGRRGADGDRRSREAATTVEEVRQTSLIASQKARAVADSAEEAEQVAEEGVAVVSEAIEGLKRISAQMAVAADCVVRLSEQTEAVGEIISTSNDIAEQSNLLSVNAAIEAAKATDAGKGFTVVAEEIKSLAQQSKQGVMQVRSILNDIQKATSAAVMAAEQSCKMVEAHCRQRRCTRTRRSRASARASPPSSQLAMQIAASAQQQLAGMDQISEVMTSINTASTQNAAGAKQMEAEVNHLHELAEEVRSMLGKTAAERAAAEAAHATATEYIRQAMVGALDDDEQRSRGAGDRVITDPTVCGVSAPRREPSPSRETDGKMRSTTMVWRMRANMLGVLALMLVGSVCALIGVSTWISLAIVIAGTVAGLAVAIVSPFRIARHVREIAGSLGASAARMLAVASQVAAGSVQTATSVSEAATTVEEVRQTALIASQKATAVADSAEEAEQATAERQPSGR